MTKSSVNKDTDFWAIISDGTPVYKVPYDKEEHYWKSGGSIFIPVFKDRKEAQRQALIVKKMWKENYPNAWFKTIPIKIINSSIPRKAKALAYP